MTHDDAKASAVALALLDRLTKRTVAATATGAAIFALTMAHPTPVEAAEGLAAHGFTPVSWVEHDGKKDPHRVGWPQFTPDQGVALVRERPGSGLGLVITKNPCGLVCLDIDKPDEFLTSLPANATLPRGPRVLTGKGVHCWFWYASAQLLPEARAHGAELFTPKSNGRYLALPPGTHPSGAAYTWRDRELPLPELPQWLQAHMQQVAAITTRSSTRARKTSTSKHGTLASPMVGRNDILNAKGYRLLQEGVSHEAMEEILTTLNADAPWESGEPLDPTELAGVFTSLRRVPQGDVPDTPVAAPPFLPKSLREWDAEPVPDQAWYIPGYVGPDILTVLGAPPKEGKTTLAVSWVKTITDAGHPVLHLDLEQGRGLLRKVYAATGISPDAAVKVWHGRRDSLGTDLAEIATYLRANPTAVLVIDSWSKLSRAESEQDNAEATREMRALLALVRETRIACLLIHHQRKTRSGSPVDDLRGASALGADADIIIGMAKSTTSPTIRVLKASGRYMDVTPEESRWRLENGCYERLDDRSDESLDWPAGYTPAQQDVLKALYEHFGGKALRSDLKAALPDTNAGVFKKAIAGATTHRWLTENRPGDWRNGQPLRTTLTMTDLGRRLGVYRGWIVVDDAPGEDICELEPVDRL